MGHCFSLYTLEIRAFDSNPNTIKNKTTRIFKKQRWKPIRKRYMCKPICPLTQLTKVFTSVACNTIRNQSAALFARNKAQDSKALSCIRKDIS